MIVTNLQELKKPCEPCSSVEEGEEIGAKLLKELGDKGVGLAANQIGINKRVCIINVKEEPLILINPEIIERSKETFVFPEGCLSFPNKHVRTIRNTSIKVKADNHDEELTFNANSKDYKDAFECACVQHEIDHLDGITMFDREFKQQPIKVNKIGRNEKVTLTKGSESKIIKFKKVQPLLEAGWTLQS